MDLARSIGAPVVKTLGGTLYQFPRLTLNDWALVQGKLAELQRSELGVRVKAMRQAGGLNPELVAALIRDLSRPPTYFECSSWLFTPAGALFALEIVTKKAAPAVTLDQLAEWLVPGELIELATDCAQLIEQREAAKEPNPLPDTSTTSTG